MPDPRLDIPTQHQHHEDFSGSQSPRRRRIRWAVIVSVVLVALAIGAFDRFIGWDWYYKSTKPAGQTVPAEQYEQLRAKLTDCQKPAPPAAAKKAEAVPKPEAAVADLRLTRRATTIEDRKEYVCGNGLRTYDPALCPRQGAVMVPVPPAAPTPPAPAPPAPKLALAAPAPAVTAAPQALPARQRLAPVVVEFRKGAPDGQPIPDIRVDIYFAGMGQQDRALVTGADGRTPMFEVPPGGTGFFQAVGPATIAYLRPQVGNIIQVKGAELDPSKGVARIVFVVR